MKHRHLALLLGVELLLGAVVAWRMAWTFDEHAHWLYGKNVLLGKPGRSSPEFESKSPLTALNAIPSP